MVFINVSFSLSSFVSSFSDVFYHCNNLHQKLLNQQTKKI